MNQQTKNPYKKPKQIPPTNTLRNCSFSSAVSITGNANTGLHLALLQTFALLIRVGH